MTQRHNTPSVSIVSMSTAAAPSGHSVPAGVRAARRAVSSLTRESAAGYVWAVARLSLGWIFLWPFLDKLFGLGHDVPSAKAWINGGNPTKGFLSGSIGPFSGIYHDLAGSAVVNVLFMAGLLVIGVGLLLGIYMRFACAAGAVLLVLMWTASLPPANDPFMDNHIVYALVLAGLALVGAGNTLGLGRWWARTSVARSSAWLR